MTHCTLWKLAPWWASAQCQRPGAGCRSLPGLLHQPSFQPPRLVRWQPGWPHLDILISLCARWDQLQWHLWDVTLCLLYNSIS